MAEVLVSFNDLFIANGVTYRARACGREMPDGRWEGWIEFEAADGTTVRSGRETTQPNRTDTAYWATGLTPVYLEGALERALNPPAPPAPPVREEPAFDGPLPTGADPSGTNGTSVLNPFSVYRKGEELLRRQLNALASWHLVNIIEAYGLSDQPNSSLTQLTSAELIELIVEGVREGSSENLIER